MGTLLCRRSLEVLGIEVLRIQEPQWLFRNVEKLRPQNQSGSEFLLLRR